MTRSRWVCLLKQALMTPAELGMLADAMWLTAKTEPIATNAISKRRDGARRDRRLTTYKVSPPPRCQDEPLTENVKNAVRPIYTTLHVRISLLIS
jgi:hypothetical protein